MLGHRALAAAAGVSVGETLDAIGVVFNGSTELSRTFNPNSNKMTLSVWAKTSVSGGSYDCIIGNGLASYVLVRESSDELNFAGFNGGQFLNADTPASALTPAQGWRHILASFDMSDTGKRLVYIDDVAVSMSYSTYSNKVWGNNAYVVGGKSGSGNNWVGSLAELYVNWGEYVDISIEANRRKFISAAGAPVNLGADGSTPTGTQPEIYLGGAGATAGTWHQNNGTAGDFSVSGSLSEDGTPPDVGS